jgi:UDP-N-acetylmuramate dehydrogenase
MKIRENVQLSELTTMRLGGVVRYVIDIERPEQVGEAYKFAKEKGLPVFILGEGANCIGHDSGYDGVILLNKLMGIEVVSEKEGEIVVKAYGGEVWDDLVAYTTERGYSGIEAMTAIPGTVGAAPVQNIGAYGQEMSYVMEGLDAYDSKNSEIVEIKPEEMELGYRRSIFNIGEDAGRYFIISITLRLRKGELSPPFYISLQKYVDDNNVTDFSPANIRKMVAEIRANKLPDPKLVASAGSFFKNVLLSDTEADEARTRGIQVWREGGANIVNSGWLIEQAGLKGQEFYGMRVSDKAALILINESAESYADLARARAHIIGVVREKYGYTLEQEPVEII